MGNMGGGTVADIILVINVNEAVRAGQVVFKLLYLGILSLYC